MSHATRDRQLTVYDVNLPQPLIGNKIFCTHEHGIYVLERGPVIWRGMCNTHVGTGVVSVYDGIPDENGFFPDEHLKPDHPRFPEANGRLLFYANPSVMGMWMFDGGLKHGLTLKMIGDMHGISPFVTITWLPFKAPIPKIVEDAVKAALPTPPPREEPAPTVLGSGGPNDTFIFKNKNNARSKKPGR